MSKSNMKELAARLKANQESAAEAAPKPNETPAVAAEEVQKKEEIAPEKKEQAAPIKKQNKAGRATKADFAFDLEDVRNWQKPTTKGARKMVEMSRDYDSFFRKARVVTGIPSVNFVNYVIRDFLIRNPDFFKYINEEAGRSPELE